MEKKVVSSVAGSVSSAEEVKTELWNRNDMIDAISMELESIKLVSMYFGRMDTSYGDKNEYAMTSYEFGAIYGTVHRFIEAVDKILTGE